MIKKSKIASCSKSELRRLIATLGQEKTAKKLGCSTRTVRKYVNGK